MADLRDEFVCFVGAGGGGEVLLGGGDGGHPQHVLRPLAAGAAVAGHHTQSGRTQAFDLFFKLHFVLPKGFFSHGKLG